MLLSGGVDSTVCAALVNKALGQDRVVAIHIDNGFMRKNESEQVLFNENISFSPFLGHLRIMSLQK